MDLAFAAEVRKFIERHWPETARGGALRTPTSSVGIGALLAALDEALGGIPDGRGGVLTDDPAFRRKALTLKVRFEALRALELKALAGNDTALPEDTAAGVLGVLCTELRLAASALVTEALGYYALPMPDERPGDNEAPPGGARARSARQGMLAGLFESPGTLDAQRDRLARRLFEAADMGESGTGH